MAVELEWYTLDIDSRIAWMARVSNPKASPNDPHEKLINYLKEHKHWSPFEMTSVCLDITTTRDIARQLLRHRSLHFQEFSQRYAEVTEDPIISEARLQDTKNRQNSLEVTDAVIHEQWAAWQNRVWDICYEAYKICLKLGIAKELARKLLPEGLTQTRLFVNGTVRDWYHYLSVRLDVSTQKEHRELAKEILAACKEVAPVTFGDLE